MKNKKQEMFNKIHARLKIVFDSSDGLVQDELRKIHSDLLVLKNLVETPESTQPIIKREPVRIVQAESLPKEEKIQTANSYGILVFVKEGFDGQTIKFETMPNDIRQQEKAVKKLAIKYKNIIKIEKL